MVSAQLLLTHQRQYVLQKGGTKSMTGKRAEGTAERGACINMLKTVF
jgi:hypothetical protein